MPSSLADRAAAARARLNRVLAALKTATEHAARADERYARELAARPDATIVHALHAEGDGAAEVAHSRAVEARGEVGRLTDQAKALGVETDRLEALVGAPARHAAATSRLREARQAVGAAQERVDRIHARVAKLRDQRQQAEQEVEAALGAARAALLDALDDATPVTTPAAIQTATEKLTVIVEAIASEEAAGVDAERELVAAVDAERQAQQAVRDALVVVAEAEVEQALSTFTPIWARYVATSIAAGHSAPELDIADRIRDELPGAVEAARDEATAAAQPAGPVRRALRAAASALAGSA
jgi:DNA repair exonuclease SbcCD ATPase subunit